MEHHRLNSKGLTILCGLPKGLTMFHWLIRDSKTMWNISPKNWASLMTHEANSPTVWFRIGMNMKSGKKWLKNAKKLWQE